MIASTEIRLLMASPSKAYIPQDLFDELAHYIKRAPGLSLTKVVREVLWDYVHQAEAEQFELRRSDGTWHTKPAGSAYPAREAVDLQPGRPLASEPEGAEVLRPISFRLPEELRDRAYNAIYWRQDVLSHVVRAGLERKHDEFQAERRQT